MTLFIYLFIYLLKAPGLAWNGYTGTIKNCPYCQTQKIVNTWKIWGMLIVYWPITIKFRIRKQTSKPQTNYRCCLRFSYLGHYWLISRNTVTLLKYFCCSQFCEFHSKSCFILSLFKVMLLSGKDKGKTGTVTEVVRSKNWVFVEGLNTVSKLVCKWDVWGLEAGFHNNLLYCGGHHYWRAEHETIVCDDLVLKIQIAQNELNFCMKLSF